MRGMDESLHREARLKPAQQEPAASESHGLKPVAKARAPAKARRGGIRCEAMEVARASSPSIMGKMPMPPHRKGREMRFGGAGMNH